MLRRLVLVAFLASLPSLAWGGPKEDAQAVFSRFLDAFTAADPATVADQFWPGVLFWGTTMTALATTPEAVRAYFQPLAERKPGERRATALSLVSELLSEGAVMISGVWQVESLSDGTPTRTPLRVSMVVTQRGGTWRIAQFHNSALPKP